jgi:mazG domain protein
MQFDDDEAFVRDAAEQGMSPLEIETGHLLAICQADFVMLHAPDGYVGLSAAMEIGFATAQECPVFSRTAPQNIALRGLVKVVPSVYDALQAAHLR